METHSMNKIIDYWFGEVENNYSLLTYQSQLWFNGGSQVDTYITQNFQAYLELAVSGELDSWKQAEKGFLALIILLDQFPRNIYRNTSQSFTYDVIALNICLEGLSLRKHKDLTPIQKNFFYMPLQHSESLEIQKMSVLYFTELLEEAPLELKNYFEDSLKYAEEHEEIIERFGRFIHRDRVLGRETNLEELEFLLTNTNRF